MKRIVFLTLLIFLFSCGKEKKLKNKVDEFEDSICVSEERRAKIDIQRGNLKYVIGVVGSSNYNQMLKVKETLKNKNIEIDFTTSTCIPSKGIKNCYEVYMNLEFLKINGKLIIGIIKNEFEKVNIKTYEIKKTNL